MCSCYLHVQMALKPRDKSKLQSLVQLMHKSRQPQRLSLVLQLDHGSDDRPAADVAGTASKLAQSLEVCHLFSAVDSEVAREPPRSPCTAVHLFVQPGVGYPCKACACAHISPADLGHPSAHDHLQHNLLCDWLMHKYLAAMQGLGCIHNRSEVLFCINLQEDLLLSLPEDDAL